MASPQVLIESHMRRSLTRLGEILPFDCQLIVGGGGALVMAYHFEFATTDIDAMPVKGVSVEQLDPYIKQVSAELGLAADWLNPYFSTFTHVLPTDYRARLVTILSAGRLTASALGMNELLLMKCFAARLKDKTHARELLRAGADRAAVETQIQRLIERRIPNSERALDFLDEVET